MPTLLCLPGLDGTGELFEPIAAELREHALTIGGYRDERTFEDYVSTVSSLLAARDNVVLAESFSGPVALAVMARFPERIRCAILCVTFVVCPLKALTRLSRIMPPAFFGTHPAQRSLLKLFCLGSGCHPQLEIEALRVLRSVPPTTIKRRLGVLAEIDARSWTPSITIPTLILRATQDKIVNAKRHAQLIQALPHAHVAEIEGPHMLLQTRPRECADAIGAFIQGH